MWKLAFEARNCTLKSIFRKSQVTMLMASTIDPIYHTLSFNVNFQLVLCQEIFKQHISATNHQLRMCKIKPIGITPTFSNMVSFLMPIRFSWRFFSICLNLNLNFIKLVIKTTTILTHISPMSHFYTPWKHEKTIGFLTFSWRIEMWYWTKMGS